MSEHLDKPITIGPRYTLLGGTPWTIPNIGTMIDQMAAAYQRYLNRKTIIEGRAALRDFEAAGKEFLEKVPKLYEWMYAQLEMPAPPINRRLRQKVDQSLIGFDAFSGRWLSLMQFCQHFSAREELSTLAHKVAKIELIYEMYYRIEELLELMEHLSPDPVKGINE